MSVTRALSSIVVVLACVAVVSASAATEVAKAPRIVAASMQDVDRDARADAVRLTYSMRVRHVRDRDGRYPFTVAGYRIKSIGAASGSALVIALVEQAQPDPESRPVIRYRLTRLQPVTAATKRQAAAQAFRSTRAHLRVPPVSPPPPVSPAPPPTAPTPTDKDGDGALDGQDCAPGDKAIHPRATDLPDLGFVDSNCDAIDGTEKDAVFVSPLGKDTDPGTREKPMRQIQAAVVAAKGKGRYVLAAAGSYGRVELATGVGVYGGYEPGKWSRDNAAATVVSGAPEGVFADGATNVTLQLVRIDGSSAGTSAYGIRAIKGASLRLERVSVRGGNGVGGPDGAAGAAGRPGGLGLAGEQGACDSFKRPKGGAGGESPVGRDGGKGGDAYYAGTSKAQDGFPGIVGTPGGKGGSTGSQQGGFGIVGASGANGAAGESSAGGTDSTGLASDVWRGQSGREGTYGAPGNGGGGGGGSGAQEGAFVVDGTGNAGSGGGGGGEGGRGGQGGQAGGGSFGIYLSNSTIVSEGGAITAGSGGAGGRGGRGGAGGSGGAGGPYIMYCASEIGRGAAGGKGGNGGAGGGGGGGAGGPSIGVMKVGASSAILTATAVTVGAGGPGGAPGAGGTRTPGPGEAGLRQAVYP